MSKRCLHTKCKRKSRLGLQRQIANHAAAKEMLEDRVIDQGAYDFLLAQTNRVCEALIMKIKNGEMAEIQRGLNG